MRFFRILLCAAAAGSMILITPSAFAAKITDEAQKIYQDHQKNVYQIQVIDLATGKKTAIGSGFQFTSQGHIATNYHVVSHAVQHPDRFRVEFIRYDGITGPLSILDIDVAHDLAVTQTKETYDAYFSLSRSDLSKGARIFSMGNPLDLGMTIVEGTYNGLMEKSLYRKILFSGSLNPGMSGGPALNHSGEVIGINVSTAGNQVSFLVPVEYLKNLYESVLAQSSPASEWDKHIEDQLLKNQDRYMQEILSSSWNSLPIGEVSVPGEIMSAFKCWGNSEDEKEKLFKTAYVDCFSEDILFLSPSHSTGKIMYRYNWVTSKGLNPIRFYNLYENLFRFPHYYENAQEEDAANFECANDFINIAQKSWKASWCARPYKKYSKLFDINFSMASVNELDKGLIVQIAVLGISQKTAVDFIQRFMKEIRWEK